MSERHKVVQPCRRHAPGSSKAWLVAGLLMATSTNLALLPSVASRSETMIMKAAFVSPAYELLKGKVSILPLPVTLLNVNNQPGEDAARKLVNSQLDVVRGVVQNVRVSQAGKFRAIITGVNLRRISDRKIIQMPVLHIDEFELTLADIRTGHVTIDLGLTQLFRIRLTYANGQPVVNATVSCQRSLDYSFQINTNVNGEIVLPGRPAEYTHIKPVSDAASISVSILPI